MPRRRVRGQPIEPLSGSRRFPAAQGIDAPCLPAPSNYEDLPLPDRGALIARRQFLRIATTALATGPAILKGSRAVAAEPGRGMAARSDLVRIASVTTAVEGGVLPALPLDAGEGAGDPLPGHRSGGVGAGRSAQPGLGPAGLTSFAAACSRPVEKCDRSAAWPGWGPDGLCPAGRGRPAPPATQAPTYRSRRWWCSERPMRFTCPDLAAISPTRRATAKSLKRRTR